LYFTDILWNHLFSLVSIFGDCQKLRCSLTLANLWLVLIIFLVYLCLSLCTKFCGLIGPTKTTKFGSQRIETNSQNSIFSASSEVNTSIQLHSYYVCIMFNDFMWEVVNRFFDIDRFVKLSCPIQHYVIQFVSDLRQVGGFLHL
jgi:hypothetical protein